MPEHTTTTAGAERPGSEPAPPQERAAPGRAQDERSVRRERRERDDNGPRGGARAQIELPPDALASMVIMGADADPCAVFTHVPGPEQAEQQTTVKKVGDEWLVLDGTEPAPRVTSFKTAVVVAIDAFRQKLLNIL